MKMFYVLAHHEGILPKSSTYREDQGTDGIEFIDPVIEGLSNGFSEVVL